MPSLPKNNFKNTENVQKETKDKQKTQNTNNDLKWTKSPKAARCCTASGNQQAFREPFSRYVTTNPHWRSAFTASAWTLHSALDDSSNLFKKGRKGCTQTVNAWMRTRPLQFIWNCSESESEPVRMGDAFDSSQESILLRFSKCSLSSLTSVTDAV